jgi:hypothetical protein
VGLGALLLLAAGLVMRQARAYAYRLPDFRVTREHLAFEDLPAWADESVRWALQPRMFPDLDVSVFDPRAEALVRSRVARHPLVRSVRGVRVEYPNRAVVRATLRVPVAQVCVVTGGVHPTRRWRLLSGDGCLLPRSPYRSYLAGRPYPLPTVTGITEDPPRAPGVVWEDRTGRVQEAAYAARLAERMFRDFHGRAWLIQVDVSRFPAVGAAREDGEVRLVVSCPPVRRGGDRVERTVEWGRTERARDQVLYEDDYATKIRRLIRVLTSRDPPRYVDVRDDLCGSRRTGP